MKIGIIGATGAVGRAMIEILEERNLPVEKLSLFASEKSKGKTVNFHQQTITIETFSKEAIEDLDYVLGAVSNELSKEYAEVMKDTGVVYIDNSSAFRLEEDIPLVVPEINGEDALKHHGIIANPNCSTIITMLALAPLHSLAKIEAVYATTFQAVSGAGLQGMQALRKENEALISGEDIEASVFPTQIAANVIAEIGSFDENGFTSEELKMQNEGRKILHQKDLLVNCTCVRVPVYRSHSISVSAMTENEVSLEDIKQAIQNQKGLKLIDDHTPTPMETSNQDLVYVGRLRKDVVSPKGISLWCCGDQIRKGAASNAIDILEYLEKHKG